MEEIWSGTELIAVPCFAAAKRLSGQEAGQAFYAYVRRRAFLKSVGCRADKGRSAI